MRRKKREHSCGLALKRRDQTIIVGIECDARGAAKIDVLPGVEAADVSAFEHNARVHRCPATRLALARVGMGVFQDGCGNHEIRSKA